MNAVLDLLGDLGLFFLDYLLMILRYIRGGGDEYLVPT